MLRCNPADYWSQNHSMYCGIFKVLILILPMGRPLAQSFQVTIRQRSHSLAVTLLLDIDICTEHAQCMRMTEKKERERFCC